MRAFQPGPVLRPEGMSEGTFLADDGCLLAYDRTGKSTAPPLVLLHSLGIDRAMWDLQLRAFSADFDVIRLDLRGHGKSSMPAGFASMDRLGRDVINLLDHLGLDRVHYCGLSIGGMVGQWLGYRAPERLLRLVLANTAPYMGPPSGWNDRIAAVSGQGMAALTAAVLERWFSPAFRAGKPEQVELVRHKLERTAPAGYAACCAAIRDMDLRPTAQLIDVPSLVVGGTLDPATTPEQSQWLAQSIRGAKLVLLEAAHLSNIEQPEAFTEAVRAFLTGG
jgi:3-oxoadipate enol-lactonase